MPARSRTVVAGEHRGSGPGRALIGPSGVPSLSGPTGNRDLRRAFTLLELLVVVAIVAILAAVLFPVFARAKTAAQGSVSLANLRNVGTAWILYAGDADGTLMPPRSWLGARRYAYWWADYDEATGLRDDAAGLLYPYTRSAGIHRDPLFDNRLRTALGLTGYGYNYVYLGSGRVSDTALGSPAETVAFATSARISFADRRTLEGNTYLEPPSSLYPTFHARANGVGYVLWADGHARSRPPVLRRAPFSLFTPAPFAAANLGEIARGGDDLTTDALFDLE